MKAYEEGLIITCGDGVTQKVFPCLFTYSADYPEKYVSLALLQETHALTDYARVLLATLKFLGNCPCVRCLIKKSEIIQMGSKLDLH